jgi:phage gpG-like protein
MSIKVTWTGKKPSNISKAAKRVLNNAPRAVGVIAVNHFKKNFEKQGFDGKPWAKRKNNSDPGRAILVKSGGMRDKTRVTRTTSDSVSIGNSSPQAQIHNEGGETHPTVTNRMRKYAWMMLKKTKNEMWKGIALTKKTKLTIRIIKRQFMGRSAPLNKDIKSWLVKAMNKELK